MRTLLAREHAAGRLENWNEIGALRRRLALIFQGRFIGGRPAPGYGEFA